MGKQNQSDGFTAVHLVITAVVVAAIALAGLYVWKQQDDDNPVAKNTSTSKTSNDAVDPYAGWLAATSTRGGFSIRYPADWTYKETVGDKDDVEHITIDSPQFHITIDSYKSKDGTTCTDCVETVKSTSFTAAKLGKVNLKTIKYKLDSGQGNALVLMLPDSTYYISPPGRTDVYTSFRAISVLDSLDAYQAEAISQFTANKDYKIAQKILSSLAY